MYIKYTYVYPRNKKHEISQFVITNMELEYNRIIYRSASLIYRKQRNINH